MCCGWKILWTGNACWSSIALFSTFRLFLCYSNRQTLLMLFLRPFTLYCNKQATSNMFIYSRYNNWLWKCKKSYLCQSGVYGIYMLKLLVSNKLGYLILYYWFILGIMFDMHNNYCDYIIIYRLYTVCLLVYLK